MTQLTLYDGNAPHAANSATSRAAGASVNRVSMRERVYDHILTYSGAGWWHGATDDEIEQDLDLIHQTVSARRRELVLLGKVVDSGRTRPTRSGRQATVWMTV